MVIFNCWMLFVVTYLDGRGFGVERSKVMVMVRVFDANG